MEKMNNVEIGARFKMRGSDFEITFAARGAIRFAPVAGGKAFDMSFADFNDLAADGVISNVHGRQHGSVNINNSTSVIRKNRYIESAFRQLRHPTARTN